MEIHSASVNEKEGRKTVRSLPLDPEDMRPRFYRSAICLEGTLFACAHRFGVLSKQDMVAHVPVVLALGDGIN